MQTYKLGPLAFELIDQANDLEAVLRKMDLLELSVPPELTLPLLKFMCGIPIELTQRVELRELAASWIRCWEMDDVLTPQEADLLHRLMRLGGEPLCSPLPKPTIHEYLGATA